jgi:replicative DNA helicase
LDAELAVLARMIQTGAVEEVIAAGVEPRHFLDQNLGKIFARIVEHHRTWQTPPSRDVVKSWAPDLQLPMTSDALGFLTGELTDRSEYAVVMRTLYSLRDLLHRWEQGDPEIRHHIAEKAQDLIREITMEIPVPRSSRYSDMLTRLSTIKAQQEAGELPGVKCGIPQLDRYIHAIRPTEFVVHAAYSGHGKTTGLVRAAIDAYAGGDDVVFFSLEMEADEVWEMFDSKAASLSREAIAKRELSVADYDNYMQAAARVASARNDVVVIDDTAGAPTVERLLSHVERYQPNTVCVDYLSLMAGSMKGEKDWERVATISRQLKQLARSQKVRVYAAAQNSADAVENGPTEDNVAFSKSIYQDANVMIGYYQNKVMEREKKVEVRLVKNRRGMRPPYGTIFEYWDRDKLIFEDWSDNKHKWLGNLSAEGAAA